MILYAVPTFNCRRVAIALEKLGWAYEVRIVDRAAGQQHAPGFRSINPAGMVPVLCDPDGPGGPIVIHQGGSILIHLAEKAGRLLAASGPQRVRELSWLMHVLADVSATASALYHARRIAADAEADPCAQLFLGRLITYLKDCSRALDVQPHLAGLDVSIADLALYPVVVSQRHLLPADAWLEPLDRWTQTLGADPAVARGMAAIR
jgi:GST-like protein